MDPYVVTSLLAETTILWEPTLEAEAHDLLLKSGQTILCRNVGEAEPLLLAQNLNPTLQ